MALKVACPGCKAVLHVREEYAGKAMQCPRCGRDPDGGKKTPSLHGARPRGWPATRADSAATSFVLLERSFGCLQLGAQRGSTLLDH